MSIITKTISELKGYRFFVPSYQRGYRWTEHEVRDLLDDINEFSTEGGKRYCIQPLIVRLRKDGKYEVVDGQQRLTTIFIFMKIAAQEITSAVPPFKLEYETREDSATFLESLSKDSDLEKEKGKNIDYYHIASAYEAINNWFDNQQDKAVAIPELNIKIRRSVYFIWYVMPPQNNPITMFTKVNLGKIPLTNAELIKALLLNKDNFRENTKKRQYEISLAWDKIEQGLQNDSFWYFLNQKDRSDTRIDMLFELLAYEYNKQLSVPLSSDQNYFSFLVFSALLKSNPQKEKFVDKLWKNVEKLYDEFCDWYADLNKYHIIGYLIVSGTKMADLIILTRGKRKSAVMQGLLEKVESNIGEYDLMKISYGNSKIRNLLLLFNIATLVCKSEKQYRFPFDIYKGETGDKFKWDIEHIHATADGTGEPDDLLRNLTLLERGTNRSPIYSDKKFHTKRAVILERELKGLFVPLCTKNIFLKVYSSKRVETTEMDNWSDDNKEDYINAMKETLDAFFNGSFAK
jgi:hypothetical protein